MAIHLDVLTALNERAAQDAADQSVRIFDKAGQDAGKAYSQALEKGLDTSGYERKMDRAADTAGRVRVEEQKLADVRKNGGADSQVVAQAERLATARRNEARAVREAADEYRKLGEAQRHAHSMMGNFGSSFGTGVTRGIPFLSGAIAELKSFEGVSGKAGFVAGKALGVAFTTAATGAIGLVGMALFKGFERYKAIDSATARLKNLNTTLERTGQKMFDVNKVTQVVTKTVEGTPYALDKAFGIATRALSTNTGDLKRFMTVVSDATAYSGGEIENIGNAFLKAANTGKVGMDLFSNELQNIPLSWLSKELGVTGDQLAKMMEKGQVGLETLMRAVEHNASGMAQAAGDTIEGALDNMQTAVAKIGANFLSAIFGKPTDDANSLKDAVKAITDRLNDVNKWVTTHQTEIHDFFVNAANVAKDLGTAIGKVAGFLADNEEAVWALVAAWGAFKVASIAQGFITLATNIGTATTALTAMKAEMLAADGVLGAAGGAGLLGKLGQFAKFAPLLAVGGIPDQRVVSDGEISKLVDDLNAQRAQEGKPPLSADQRKMLGDNRPVATANAAPVLSTPAPPPAGMKRVSIGGALVLVPQDWQDPTSAAPAPAADASPGEPGGLPILEPPGLSEGDGKKKKGAKGPRLPGAPALEYDSTAPDGFTPTTAAEHAAVNSYLDARHKLAEKRARLTQLEGEANATEADKIKARNDILTAERNLQQAERRLNEAKQRQTEKATKTLKGLTADLGDIGASLDKDFGISKGLAGIAENITKFVANLAAAPLLGRLGAVSAMDAHKGGYGLMGILGAQGVFGAQYTGLDADASAGYGMTGGYGASGSGKIGLDQIDRLATQFGLTVSSGTRSGDPGYHGKGMAHDYAGPESAMRAFADFMNRNYGGQLKELIHDAPGFSGNVKDGRNVGAFGQFYTNAQAGPHNDHVHVAADPMSSALDANTAALNANTGAVNGDHVANWDMIAQRESSGNWSNMDTGNNGHYGGLQFSPSTWNAYGGQEFASNPAYASAEQQKTVADRVVTGYNGVAPQGLNAWEVYTQASPADRAAMATPTGYGTAGTAGYSSPTGYGVPGGSLGMPGQGGLGAPTGFMQPTQIGAAVDPPRGAGGGGGVGISGDGAIGMAMQAGGMALDMMAPGAGQAAQMGMKLLNRTIEYGGQAAGIAAGGLMETFLPTGGSDLANNNWLTRIMGGLAGAAPALPNLAGGKGKAQPPLDGQQGQAGQQGQGGVQIGDINVTNQRPTEDGTGRDIAYHLNNQYSGPGM